MASSSSSHKQNGVQYSFSSVLPELEPSGKRRKVEESIRLYDVFINHRGSDVGRTLATQLYESLKKLGIRAFIDSEEKQLGASFPSCIETAIRSARVHIPIFSKRYAEATWCLQELFLLLETQAIIIPVFYDVKPWELRHIEEGVYKEAFVIHEKKGRPLERLIKWKEALGRVSCIPGWESNNMSWIDDLRAIVSTVQKEMQGIYPVELSNSMASSSSPHRQIVEHSAVSGLAPEPSRHSDVFDVFINYRGPDVKETLALPLYNSLEKLGLRVFLDSEERELGDSFPSTIQTAIRYARVHIVIFSRGYVESPWCLEELVFMLRTEAIVIPLFYGVKPSELYRIETGGYFEAFIKYEGSGKYLGRLNEWKEALHSTSLIVGYVIKGLSNFNCEPVVSAVQKQLRRTEFLYVAKYPVGLSKLVEELERGCLRELVQDFDSRHGMNKEGKGKAQILGIYGMAGAGKTTLSKELFNRYRSKYNQASFLVDVREASARGELPSLQLRLLKDLFDEDHPSFTSTDEGISYLRYAFGRSRRDWRFLIVLDDIDRVEQLYPLLDLDSMNSGCLVIVTTRDVQVLKDANIADGYEMKEMGVGHSRELFCWQAFGQANPPIGYEDLVESFVEESGFLPLSLQLFGGLVRDEADKSKWHSYLHAIRKQPNPGIKERLQISVDTLDEEERQMFMDIACFFIDKPKSMAIRIWDGCGWKAQQALQKLERKCLVHIAENYLAGYEFDDKLVLKMHDLIRDVGREMADHSFPRRNWRPQSLESNGFENILRETSGPSSRSLNSLFDSSMASQITYFIGNLDQRRTSLLWLELDGCEQPSLPSWIPLQHLRGLRIFSARLRELWQNNSQAPVNLKELVLHECSLAECTNSVGMLNDLEKLVLTGRNEEMLVDGRALSKSLRGLTKLRSLVLRQFTLTGELTLNGESTDSSALRYFAWISATLGNSFRAYFASSGEAELINNGEPTMSDSATDRCMCDLQTMEMRGIKRVSKVSISEECCRNLESLHLASMPHLIQVDLTVMRALNCLELRLCEQLKTVSGNFDLPNLETLNIDKCGELEELPSLELLKCSKRIVIDGCEKLPKITGVEKLMGLRCLHLSGGHIWRCIHSLKKLPSVVTSVIGKASSQAKAILDTNQFRHVIGADTNRAIHINEAGMMLEESLNMSDSLSAIIICAVVRGSYASGTNPVNICLPSGLIQSNISGGISIVTIVITGQKDVRDYKELPTVGGDAQIKNRWIVTIQKGQEGNPLHVLRKIIEELYQ